MATLLLAGLADAGVQVDGYVATLAGSYRSALQGRDNLRLIEEPMQWDWDRWYSRQPVGALATGQLARVRAQHRLVRKLRAEHARHPYDLIYQFSQLEVPWSRTCEDGLPPVVVHPEVHIAGELRWHIKERALARRCQGYGTLAAASVLLGVRTLAQRRDARRVSAIIAPSRIFAWHLETDYGVAADRIHVVRNPIDLDRFAPPFEARRPKKAISVELLFVSRLAVRKGVEMIVALSHRLAVGPVRFRITVAGDRALFSDYRGLLDDLHPDVGVSVGQLPAERLADLYRSSDALLQPSHYEPFALTVGEALASGLPVVVSDAVGAAEDVDQRCCRVFPAGDLDAFERQVRELSAGIGGTDANDTRHCAREEAERLFAPAIVCSQLSDALARIAETHGS